MWLVAMFLLVIFSVNTQAQQKQAVQWRKPIQLPKKPSTKPQKKGGNQTLSLANNQCSGATTLVYNVPVLDNNIGVTQDRAPIVCNGFASTVANDVWFKFVYTIQMDSLKVIPQNDDVYDIVLELMSGTCSNLTTIACADNAEPNSNNQTEGFLLSSFNLTPGNTYYFRVYGWNGTECNFTAQLSSGLPPPPGNDVCSANTQIFAGSTIGGTTVGATQSLAPSSCGGFTSTTANDVWFRFLKSASMDSLIVYPDIAGLDMVLEIRSGSCTASSQVSCSDQTGAGGIEKISLSGLTNGTTYLVRVYGYDGTSGDFAIRIKSAPTNDNCSGAQLVQSQITCPLSTIFTTSDATQSLTAISCNGFTGAADDDVWFRFVAAANIDSFFVYPIGTFDPVVDLRTGTCATSTTIRCSDDPDNAAALEKVYVGGLTAGTTYYVRVYSYGNVAGSQGTFRVCLRQTTTTLPANDECPNSVVLQAGGVINNGNNNNATQSLAPVACGGFTSSAANDVWYQFIKTDQTDTLVVTPGGTFDAVVELRNNACTNGLSLGCSDNLGSVTERIVITNLTNGETYLVRIYGWGGATGSYTIRLADAVSAPDNDECFAPLPLTLSTSCTPISASNIGATQSQDPGACSGSTAGVANDVWYVFTANGTNAVVKLGCGVGFDGAVEVFSGGCFNLNSIGCADAFGASTQTATATETIYLTGLSNGVNYYVRVYGYQGATGTFNLCVYNPDCNSQQPSLSLSKPAVISNEAFRYVITGVTGAVEIEYSTDQTNWINLGLAGNMVDTLIPTSTSGTTFFLRALNQDGSCFPAFSSLQSINVRCATPFTGGAAASGDNIRRIQISNLDNNSTTNPLGGSVQDFTQSGTAISVCRGNVYPISITANKANQAYNRMVWIDLNQDGDFEDVGENLVFGTYVAGLTVIANCTIPANATLGNTKMRVSLINNGASITASNPCATGPYASGEIEEYAVTITNGVSANAGQNQSICSTTTTLAGNDPGTGNTGLWTVISGTGNFANASSPTTSVSGLSPGANVFRWTITGSCGATGSNVTITSTGISASAGADQSVCAGNATLNATTPASGTGTWTVFTGGASVTNPGSATSGVTNLSIGLNQFIWTVTQTGCTPATDTVTITRSTEPSNADAGPAQTICVGNTSLTGNTPQVGTGLWTVVQGVGVIANPTSPSTTVSGMANGVNRFRWTISNGACPPKFSEVTVAVGEPPVANAGQNQTICAQNASLSGNQPAASTVSWSQIAGSGQIANPSAANTAVSGLGIGQNIFVYTIVRGNCAPVTDTVIITRKAPPVSNAGNAQNICSDVATMAATAPTSGTGIWTLVSGSGTIVTPTSPFSSITNLGVGANVFRWTVTDAPCTPASSEVTITRQANTVTANAGNDATICDANYNLNGNAAGTGTGLWSVISGSGTFSNASNPNASVSGLGVGINIFRWTISSGNCPPSFDDVVVTRQAATTVAIAGPNQNICATATTLAANTPSQGVGAWSVVSGSGQFANATSPVTGVTGLSTGANVFRWTITNAPCAASTSDVTITSTGNVTTAVAGPAQLLCADQTQLAGNTPTQGTGTWTLVSGTGTIAEPGNPLTGVSNLGIGVNTFRWTITNGACPPSTSDVHITRQAPPSAANAGANQNICGSATTLNATAPTVGTGIWSLVSGTGTIINPTQANTAVSGLGNGANVFRWTVSNAPCGAVSAEVTITTTLSVPSANAGPAQILCQTNTLLAGNNPSPGNGVWTVVSGSGTFANPTSPTTTVSNMGTGDNIFRWTINSGTCPPSSAEVTITVRTNPTQATAGNDQNICGSTATLAGNTATIGTGLWTLVSGSGTIVNPGSPSSQVVNLGAGANVFRWTISNAPCPASQSTVTLNSTPSNLVANAGPDQTVCAGNATLIAVAPTQGTGQWSLISGTGTILSSSQAVSPVSGLSPGANSFLWTVTNGNCTATDVVVVNVETNPIQLKEDTIVCLEVATSILLNGPTGMASYNWSNQATSQSIQVSASGPYILQVLTLNGCIFKDTSNVTFTTCTDVKPGMAQTSFDFRILPNPSSQMAYVQLEAQAAGAVQMEVLDMRGVILHQETWATTEGKQQLALPAAHFPSGAYLVRISGKQGQKVKQWLIHR